MFSPIWQTSTDLAYLFKPSYFKPNYLCIKAHFKTLTSLCPPTPKYCVMNLAHFQSEHCTERSALNHVSSDSKILETSAPDLNFLGYYWVKELSLTAAGLINLNLLDKQMIWGVVWGPLTFKMSENKVIERKEILSLSCGSLIVTDWNRVWSGQIISLFSRLNLVKGGQYKYRC